MSWHDYALQGPAGADWEEPAGSLVRFQFYKLEPGTRMVRLQVLACGTGTGPCRGLYICASLHAISVMTSTDHLPR